jgi:hypothetical protein
MGIFRRKPELDQLRARRTLLEKQLVTAERELAAAVEARQKALLEGDLDTPLDGQSANGVVGRLHDEKAAVLIALTTLGERIAEAESKLAAEHDLAMRSAAGKELSTAADALDRAADEVAAALARVFPTLDDVLSKLPLPHLVQKANLKVFSDAVVESLRAEVGEARAYIVRLTSGDAALVPPRPDDVKTAPAPIVERRQIFLLVNGRWPEPDGTVRTAGRHIECDPPAAIAKLAIEYEHALEPTSEFAQTLRMRMPPCYAHFAESDCVDISQPKQLIKQVGATTAAAPVIHSEFARGRGGFASVSRNSR